MKRVFSLLIIPVVEVKLFEDFGLRQCDTHDFCSLKNTLTAQVYPLVDVSYSGCKVFEDMSVSYRFW